MSDSAIECGHKECLYKQLVSVAADSAKELRKCDVFRVVDTANNAGKMLGFCDWLRKKRPDLTDEILDCIGEVYGWHEEGRIGAIPTTERPRWVDAAAAEIVKEYPHSACSFDQFESVREIIFKHYTAFETA